MAGLALLVAQGCAAQLVPWGEPRAGAGSVPPVHLDLAGFGQHVDDVRLEVGVMHSCLPELPGVAVVFPVVVPVALAVSAKPEDVHLQQ